MAALEKITVEDVNALFEDMFFENPRRLNIKLHSQNHLKNEEEVAKANEKNQEWYSDLETTEVEKIKLFCLGLPKFPKRKNL
mmetsp:Transcript_25543/g.39314  ORF Transcript_25543/g.39314 Transcript_25543/m.39314 type:complete len:82 (+) Transcript_25543:1678-1923(+)